MQKNSNETRMEFVLTLNNNIIIQRFFFVKDYNPLSKNSLELYYCITNIVEEIKDDLKRKSFNFSYENQSYFQNLEDVDSEEQNSDENFLLEIKLKDDIFIQRIFPAYVYHPKARYSVDIRPKVSNILSYLTSVLSMKRYNTTYLNKKILINEKV